MLKMQDVWQERQLPQHSRQQGDHRSPFQRDKARILHSAAFRRLQAKTQVLGVGISDFYRTRLTHSLEASQIGQGIVAQLGNKYPELANELDLNAYLIEALCLAHDIGHPPFGHGGEVALNYMMHPFGGFEGNGQTFRIVTKLEAYTQDFGMNLSRRTLLGLVKYPNFIDLLSSPTEHKAALNKRTIKAKHWHPAKGLYTCDTSTFDWMLAPLSANDKAQFISFVSYPDKHSKTQFKSFDCSIMELADDIAYGIHDLEDAIAMGIIHQGNFRQEVVEPLQRMPEFWLQQHICGLGEKLFSHHQFERKDAIGALVNAFITAIEISQVDASFDQPLLKFNAKLPAEYCSALELFKRFVFSHVILKPDIQLLEYKGQQVVMELFEAFCSDPERLLPENTRQRWYDAATQDNGERVISDYISGMTDEYASRLYANLFIPKSAQSLGQHIS